MGVECFCRNLCETKPGRFINQFPLDCLLTAKDLMCAVARGNQSSCDPATMETGPAWLQTSYNLQTELAEFVSYFQHREARFVSF